MVTKSDPFRKKGTQLLDFKYNATEYLRQGDRGQIDYPDAEIIRWTIKRKGEMLSLLRRWKRQYQLETTLEAKKQRALTNLGSQLSVWLLSATHPDPLACGGAVVHGLDVAGASRL